MLLYHMITRRKNYEHCKCFHHMVHSSQSHEHWLSSLLPIKMTFISGIYCYVLIGVFFANCETKTITKDKWVHNTAGIRFDDTDVQSPHLRLRREKSLGDSCVSDEDCNKHIDNSECRLSWCECRANFTRNTAIKNTDRDSRRLLCYKINNSYVNDVAVDNNSSSDNTTRSPSSPEKFESTTMLPIMIVLGIMFIGMCVALNLFSRAQFRNSRSLFTSNSHVVKAGSRSASHRRTSYPTLPVGSASQHRLNSVGSGSGNESPTQALRTSTHSQLADSHLRNQRMTRVNDDCISSTTVANVNLTITNEVNGASFASETSSQMHH